MWGWGGGLRGAVFGNKSYNELMEMLFLVRLGLFVGELVSLGLKVSGWG
jgi:hypothetical protein